MNNTIKTPNIDRKPSSLRYYQEGPPTTVDLNDWRLSIAGLVEERVKLFL